MLSIKQVFAYSIRQIFRICFLMAAFLSVSVFGQTPNSQKAQALPANQVIERELAGGQTHTYRITLKADEFLQVKAEQKGVDVVIRLFDSNQKQLVEVNSSDRASSPKGILWFEELLFISEKEGEYEIQISALKEKAVAGKYTLQWSRQNAIEKNRTRVIAKKLYDDGYKLRRKPESESEAITKLKEALKLYQQIGDLEGELNSVEMLGSLSSRRDKSTSLEYHNQALSIARKLGDKRIEASLLVELVFLHFKDEPQKQLDYLNQALSIWRNIGDKNGEGDTLEAIGDVYSRLGNFQKVIEYYSQAISLKRTDNRSLSKPLLTSLLFKISKIYEKSGDEQKALDFRNEGELLSKQINDKREFSNEYATFLNLQKKAIEFLKAGDYQKFIESANQVLALAPLPPPMLIFSFAKLCSIHGDKEIGVKCLDEMLLKIRAGKVRRLEALILNYFGNLYEKLGDNQKAFDFYHQSLLLHRALGEKDNEVNRLKQIVNFLASVGNAQLAVVYGKQAVNIIQQFRSEIKELDKETQKAYLKHNEPIYRKLADILISEGRFPEAQAVLDLLKEEEFKQIVRRSGGEPLYTLPYSRAEEAAIKIVDRLAALGHELSDLKAKPKDSLTAEETKRISEIESVEIPAANKALRQAIEALSTVAPDVKNALDLRMKDNIQNILPALGKGVVALYTVVGKTTADESADNKNTNNKINIGWILLVTPEFRKAYPIDTKDLEQTVFKLRQALRSPQYDPQPIAQELYKKLFLHTSTKQKTTLAADLETYLGQHKDKTLMWSLDGVLRYVPMAALFDGKQYLVEKYRNVVFNTASLGSLKDSTKPNWEVLGLGVSTEGTVKAFDGTTLRFSALKGSEIELNSIVKEIDKNDSDGIFSGTLKMNNEFTKEALFEGARTGKPVIHVSSHFWFNPAQEETSFLLLGNGNRLEVTEFQDYPNLFSNVDFLSLSACDTATGGNANTSNTATETDEKARESNGKEIEGFAYIAQTLGAKSVMASLWQVSDEGTKELMLKFYQIKKEQPELPKGEALRQAQLSLLQGSYKTQQNSGKRAVSDLVRLSKEESLKPFVKDSAKPFAHPYYWSPFVLIGNWR